MANSMISLAPATALAATAIALPAVGQTPDQGGQIEEVVVTGTYIRRPSQFDSPSPLVNLDADDLASQGHNEVGRVLEDLTINTGSQNNPDAFTQNFTTGTTNINLRGLGVSSTLVLINGRRQTQSAVTTDRGENFVDISSMPPMIAFERIEILKDGATALYGSEAVAGVTNFITRTGFEGFDLELGLQGNDRHPQQDAEISGLWGGGTDATRVLVAFSHLDREPLTTFERRLSGPGDDVSQAGNPGSFLVPSLPGNPAYRSVWTAAFDSNRNGVADFVEPTLGLPAVPGAQPPVFADQDCLTIAEQDPKVVPSFAALVPSPIGRIPLGLCQFDFGGFYSIVPEERRSNAFAEVRHEFGDTLQGRIEAHVADNEARRNNSPSFPFAAFPTIAANHPDNPYGSDVRFIGRLIGAGGVPIESVHNSDTYRLAGSLTGTVNNTWVWEVGLQHSENDFFVSAPDVLVDRFDNAIRGLGGAGCNAATGAPGVAPCVYFNPFGSALTGTGTRNSPELLNHIIGFESFDAHSELTSLEGFASRELTELAGGYAALAFGAQYRGDELSYDYDENANRDNFLFLFGNPDFGDDRDVEAVFVEFALPFTETINLQLAGRYESYGDGVDSTDPKATLLWRPTLDFSLRASIGTSFRAPSLFQAFGTQTTLGELIDPNVGTPQFFPVRTRPNPSGDALQPEEADVFNVGVSFSPSENWEIGVDYWSYDYKNVIIEQNAQAILNAAAQGNAVAGAQVIRDPASGLLLRVDSFYDNASALETDGIDLSVSRELALRGGGELRTGFDATFVASYDLDDPQAGTIDGAGRRNFANFGTSTPERRANAFVTWSSERHGVSAFLRYIDSYVDDEVELGQGSAFFRPIDSQVTLDAQYTLTLRAARAPRLTFGGINLTDEDPPRVRTSGGYDSKVHDPRGRMLYAKALFRF
jgi:outer membrane receptor protein involved in Fe transport